MMERVRRGQLDGILSGAVACEDQRAVDARDPHPRPVADVGRDLVRARPAAPAVRRGIEEERLHLPRRGDRRPVDPLHAHAGAHARRAEEAPSVGLGHRSHDRHHLARDGPLRRRHADSRRAARLRRRPRRRLRQPRGRRARFPVVAGGALLYRPASRLRRRLFRHRQPRLRRATAGAAAGAARGGGARQGRTSNRSAARRKISCCMGYSRGRACGRCTPTKARASPSSNPRAPLASRPRRVW